MVRTKKQLILLVILLLVSVSELEAQTGNLFSNRRLESWNGLSVDYKPMKDWKLSLEEQFRMTKEFRQFDRLLTELSLEYNPSKKGFWRPLSFASGVRYTGLWDGEGGQKEFENHLRFQFDLRYELKVWRLYFEARHRYQRRRELVRSDGLGPFPASDFRTRLSLGFNFKNWKWDPVISYEFFLHQEQGEPNGFSRYRLRFGTNYKLNKKIRFSFYYMREQSMAYFNPRISHILVAKMKYRINRSKKKKK